MSINAKSLESCSTRVDNSETIRFSRLESKHGYRSTRITMSSISRGAVSNLRAVVWHSAVDQVIVRGGYILGEIFGD